jgi:hypothetical protein
MICSNCDGGGYVSAVYGDGLVQCPSCRDGMVDTGPYSAESAVGCATLPQNYDARTEELVHGTRPGKLSAALCSDLRRQNLELQAQLDAALSRAEKSDLAAVLAEAERDAALKDRDIARLACLEIPKLEEERDENARLHAEVVKERDAAIRAADSDAADWDREVDALRQEAKRLGAVLARSRELLASTEAQVVGLIRRRDGGFDFLAHLRHQREWSEKTFGPGPRPEGISDHIRKELLEIEAAPDDLEEWIDVAILALDGAWRAGHSPEAIVAALVAKQAKNEGRAWPDWRTAEPGRAIEHVRDIDADKGQTNG